METLKNKTTHHIFLLGILFLIIVSINCSKDDELSDGLQDKKMSYEVTGLNQCNTNMGIGTSFMITIFYKPPGGAVNRLFITQKSPNDGVWESFYHGFTNTNDIIKFTDCFRFDENAWVDYEVVIASSDGTNSNPFKIRVNKPAGAN